MEAVDQLGGEADHVEHAMPGGDIVIESLQGLLAENQSALLVAGVIHAFERQPFPEEDQTGCVIGQQPHIAGVALFLEGRDEAREVHEGRLERVVDDLSRRHGNGLTAVLGLWSVLHAASRLGCFHLPLRYRMIAWRLFCIRLVLLRRPGSLFGGGLGRLDQLGNAGLDGLVRWQLCLGIELELASWPVERADHGRIARDTVALRVKEVAEQEIQRGGFA